MLSWAQQFKRMANILTLSANKLSTDVTMCLHAQWMDYTVMLTAIFHKDLHPTKMGEKVRYKQFLLSNLERNRLGLIEVGNFQKENFYSCETREETGVGLWQWL